MFWNAILNVILIRFANHVTKPQLNFKSSVTNHHCGLRLRRGEPTPQRTRWHVTGSHGGHVTDPGDPRARIWDPRDPGLLEGPVRHEGTI